MTNKIIKDFIKYTTNEEADEILLKYISVYMREKLRKKREEGRGGWYTLQCCDEDLIDLLKEHIKKEDWIDVVNLAAMLHTRKILYD